MRFVFKNSDGTHPNSLWSAVCLLIGSVGYSSQSYS